ncbi:MAG: outer membrane beta-barrel protein [Ignavibacteriaceae bacterium]|nr:outer membrane beta-barrel protein [Ignavibacteriaceae bacterium]
MKLIFVLFLFLFSISITIKILPQSLVNEQSLQKFEVSVGFGSGTAFENDIFKTEIEKVKASPEAIINFAMHYIIDPNLSFGFLLEGYTQTVGDVAVTLPSGELKNETFDLACINIGVDGRWTFSRGSFEPYGFASINLVNGTLQNNFLGNLSMTGVSIGGGLGTKLNFSQHWAVAIEAIGFLGTAKWKQKVFTNSTGTSFNPSHAGLTLAIVYRWGDM